MAWFVREKCQELDLYNCKPIKTEHGWVCDKNDEMGWFIIQWGNGDLTIPAKVLNTILHGKINFSEICKNTDEPVEVEFDMSFVLPGPVENNPGPAENNYKSSINYPLKDYSDYYFN